MNRFESGPRPETRENAGMQKALRNEQLTSKETRELLATKGKENWPTEEKLAEHMRSVPEEAIKRIEEHRAEIVEQGGNPDSLIAEVAEYRNFENFTVRKLEETEAWPFIKGFVESRGLSSAGISVVEVDDPEYWYQFYGSNVTKSSVDAMTVIVDKNRYKDLADRPDAQSWMVHELAHLSFYSRLGDKLKEHVARFERDGRYIDSSMESVAYRTQFGFLKEAGLSREQALEFLDGYLEESFGSEEELSPEMRARRDEERTVAAKYIAEEYGG